MKELSSFQLMKELVFRLDAFLYDNEADETFQAMDTEDTEKLYFTLEEYCVIYRDVVERTYECNALSILRTTTKLKHGQKTRMQH